MLKAVTLDLDGTVYIGSRAVEGAAEFIAFLRSNNIRLLFVTNRANRLPDAIASQLNEMGIACSSEEILTSSQATAEYLEPGPAYIIGENGLADILLKRGFSITDKNPRYVIVSFDRHFNYDKLKTACSLIHRGAAFIATNPDNGLPTENGITPGTGAIVAAVQAGSGVKPTIIGKPEPLILQIAARQMGVKPGDTMAVGDNLLTDLPSGISAGMMTAIVLTGLSTMKDVDISTIKPDFAAPSFAALTKVVQSLI
jgi:4-nitrophenyl phosphatase